MDLFGINMPLLYGEGTRAFIRLQEEILKSSDDESLFAWGFRTVPEDVTSLFATSPIDFAGCGDIIDFTPAGFKSSHYTLTNKGLYIETNLLDNPIEGGIALARLNCSKFSGEEDGKSVALVISRSTENDMILSRHQGAAPVLVPSNLFLEPRTQVYVHRSIGHAVDGVFTGLMIRCRRFGDLAEYSIPEFYPPARRYGPLIWCQKKDLKSQHQSILFLIETVERPNYAVWLDYNFRIEGERLAPVSSNVVQLL
jgi:hypothetical protein